MREIEVKYRVEDMEALLVALKSRGIELSEPVFQDDQAYAPAGWQFGAPEGAACCPSVTARQPLR